MADLASLVIRVDSRDANRAKTSLDSLATSAGRTERATDGMGRSARGAGSAFAGLASFITTASAAAAAAKFVQVADQMTNLESRIKLTMSATQSYTDIQSKLSNIAKNSVTSLQDVGTLYARIAPSIERLGGTQRESLAITSALTNALRINGATTAEASSAVIQFSQAMQSGVLRGEEFNALNENAGPLLDALAGQLGKTRGELRQMAFDGLLTSDVVANNLLPAVAGLEAKAASMGVTSSAAFQDLSDALSIAIGEIDKTTGATAALSGIVSGATQEVTDLIAAMRTGELSATQQDMIGIAGALGGATVAAGGLAVAIGTITAAQWLFNAAVRANPLIMGLSVVTAGIAAAYGYAKAQDAAKSSQDKLNEALKAKANIDERLRSSSPSVVAAAKRSEAGANALVANLKKVVAAEENAAQVKIIKEAEAEFAEDQARKGQAKTAAGYVKLSGAATAAADVVKKASDDKAKAAEDAAKRIRDAQVATQSALDDQYLQQNLGMSSASLSLVNDPNATPDQINQNNALEAQAIAADKAKTAIEGAQEAFDSYINANYGADLASGFDQASAALGRFVQGIETLGTIEAGNAAARKGAEAEFIANKIDQSTLTKKLAKLDAKYASDQIGAFADITGSAKGFFKEGSKGYKALQTAEQVFRLYQLAMNAKVIAAQVAGYFTSQTAHAATVAPTLAGEAAKATAMGTTAVAAQATVPVAGPALAAAMIAFLAGIGILIGGGGKKGPGFTDNTGTGTVLGDSSEQSKSIKNSIEALESAASLENRISSAMLASLKNIEANISGLASLIVRGDVGGGLSANVNTGFKMDGIGKTLNFLANPLPFLDFLGLGKALGKVLGGLFGSKSKITGQGLTAVSQTLGDIMQNGFDLLEFVAIQTKKKSFGITTSTKNSIRTSMADPELTRQFGLIFSDFGNAIVAAADPLGFSTEDIAKRLESFVVDIGKINLKGLKGDEIQEKLEAVFGAQADKMAEYAFPMLTEFQKVGEGLFETVVRVASGIEQADTLLTRLGLTAVNYTTLLNTQGDITTEIIRQSVLLTDRTKGIAGGFAEIVENFQGTGEEITDLVLQLRDMQDAIRATGKAGEYLTTFMIAGAGGADRLTSGLDAFFDFLSPAEQAAELTRRVSAEFSRIGQIVPQSVQGFRELIARIDISTEAGQKLYGQVIALAPAFSDLQDALESVKDEAQDARDAITKAFKDLSDAIKTAESDLQAAFNRESAALKDLIRNHDDAAKRLREFSRSLVGALDTPEQSLSRLRAEFDAIARSARLGDSAAVSRLPEVGGALKDAVLANAVTALDAAREIAKIRAESDAAATVQERQKTIAEQQLDALTLSVDSLIQVGDNILTVRDAVDNLKALQTFENKAIADATALGLNSLAQQNGLTLSAIERGIAASNAINAGIASLVGIQAKQEADRQAAIAAQKAEAERQAKINALTAQAKPLTDVVAQQVAVRSQSAADLAKLQADAYALASAKGVAINAESGAANFTNTAQFGVGDSGLYEQKFGQISFRNSPAGANAFKSEFYAAGGIYDQILAEAAQLASAKSARETSEAQLNALRQQITALGGIPAFATGGMHSGGLRLVGENGPELEYTGPSRIFNAGQTSSMLDNSDQIAELRTLRDEMKGYLWSISKSTLRTADRLDRWDDGDRMNVRIDNESDDPALVRTVA